jgi:hypothetical protein
MRVFLLGFIACLISFFSMAQGNSFPQDWIGNWKGEMEWFRTGREGAQKVNVELRIQPDSSGSWTWHIIYNSVGQDSRPYILKAKDPAIGHWVIDERNGIVLDQFWVGNRFCGAFTVQNATIINNYWLEGNKLMIEFFNVGAKAIATSGNGTVESPKVDSYRVGAYQKAVLTRSK